MDGSAATQTIERLPGLAVLRTEVALTGHRRVSIEWHLTRPPGPEWLAAFRHPSCVGIPARLGVTTAYGVPLTVDGGVVIWSVEATELALAVEAGAAMIERATAIATLLAS